MSLNKTIRLRTTPGDAVGTNIPDNNIQFKIEQEFDTLDILSLKITQADAYRNFCSDYGVVVGRVIANDGFGVENAKVSIFIPLSDEDAERPEITTIYPYRRTTDTNGQGIRYNLLSKDGRTIVESISIPNGVNPNTDDNYSCSHNGTPKTPWIIPFGGFGGIGYQGDTVWERELDLNYGPKTPVGTFPSKSDILDNDTILEVYDKYYKFTTTTNSAGDYMLFGVPVGVQTIHMDVDLSDTGNVSLSVQDFINAGFPQNLFNGNDFKSSTNLDALPQIESRDTSIDVIPFWGNLDQCEIGITRLDFNLNKTVVPSAVLAFHSFTNISGYVKAKNTKCNVSGNQDTYSNPGNMQPFATTTTAVDFNTGESYTEGSFGGNTIMKVPMSRERYITNEFGDYILSPDQSKGIPTEAQYQFYINPTNQNLAGTNARASYVFPWGIVGGPSYPRYVTLKYDLFNRRTRYYTIGNRNFGCYEDADDCRRQRIRSHNQENNSNKNYPISTKSKTSDKSIFGEGFTCYGSLYFPRFEVDDGDVCGEFLANTSSVYVQNAAGNQNGPRIYNEKLRAESLLDITFLMKLFEPFGGTLPISSHTHGIGSFINGAANVILSNPNTNGQNLIDQTYPLRNSISNASPSTTLGSITFPRALDAEQIKPFDDSVISYATCYNAGSGCNSGYIDNVQLGTSTIPGRYFFYFGLTNSNNILKRIKDTEDV
jgi:hypothetical protein